LHDALSALCTTPSPRPDAGGVFQHGVPGPALRRASSSTVGVAPRDVKYVLSFFWAIAALSLATLIGASWWALPRHFADTSETPPRHLRDTSETLPRHLRDISETLPRHFRERHFRDNSTPPRHLLAALPRPPHSYPRTPHLPPRTLLVCQEHPGGRERQQRRRLQQPARRRARAGRGPRREADLARGLPPRGRRPRVRDHRDALPLLLAAHARRHRPPGNLRQSRPISANLGPTLGHSRPISGAVGGATSPRGCDIG